MSETEILGKLMEIGKGRHGFFDLFIQGKWKTINSLLDEIRNYDSLLSQTYDFVERLKNRKEVKAPKLTYHLSQHNQVYYRYEYRSILTAILSASDASEWHS